MQTEAHTDSDGGNSDSVGHSSNPLDQHKCIKQEDPEAENYVCKCKEHKKAYSDART